MDRKHSDLKWLAWHIEALSRQKRLMSFKEMMGLKEEKQDIEELDASLLMWMARHNQRLSEEDRHVVVLEEG